MQEGKATDVSKRFGGTVAGNTNSLAEFLMDRSSTETAKDGRSVIELSPTNWAIVVDSEDQNTSLNANDASYISSKQGHPSMDFEKTSRPAKSTLAECIGAEREQGINQSQDPSTFRSLPPSTAGFGVIPFVPPKSEQSLEEQTSCTKLDSQVPVASSPHSDGSNSQQHERTNSVPPDMTAAGISPSGEISPPTCTDKIEAMAQTACRSESDVEEAAPGSLVPKGEAQTKRKDDSRDSPMDLQAAPTWSETVLEPSTSLTVETLAMQDHRDHHDHHSVEDDSSHYHDTDSDSALGDMSTVSSMTSVTSSIYESVTENGRTYHSYKPGKYVLPNDVKEQGRLDTQHYLLCEAIGGRLYKAPLEPHKVNRVLDIATGTGIWAIEFADDFPNAEVIGTDLTPIQPRWCPPNCYFEVDDAEDEWIYTSPFSYIHGRALLSCFENPEDVISKCAANLEPGGWLEFQDAVIPFVYDPPNIPSPFEPFDDKEPDCVLRKWEKLTIEASIIGRRPWTNVQHYKKWFEQAGLVDVSELRTKLPIGQWEGQTKRERKMGAVHFSNVYHGLDGMTLRNLTRLGWTFEQSQNLVEDVRKEMLTKRYKPSNEYVVVMGRKPEAGEVLTSD